MKINKNLAEALLMLSCISLVLVGTTVFENATTKTVIMVVCLFQLNLLLLG